MPDYPVYAYSVPIGEFDTAVNFGDFGATFSISDPIEVTITDDDGILQTDLSDGATVSIGDDDQGSITSITYRTITLDHDGVMVEQVVAIIERDAVADYLLIPVDTVDGEVEDGALPVSDAYGAGDLVAYSGSFDLQTPGAPCFVAGTMIRTPEGEVAIEMLSAGDLVSTRDNGALEILWIGSRKVYLGKLESRRHLTPVKISEGAIGNERELVLSPDHRVLVSSWQAEVVFGEPEVLVAARDLVNDGSVTRAARAEWVEYFHILVRTHELIWANGQLCETLLPSELALGKLAASERATVHEIFPELREMKLDPVRPMLSSAEARTMIPTSS